jgi:hypothetical protein
MSRQCLVTCSLVAGALIAGACNRGEEPVPPAEVQSQASQPANQPVAITGCLKAGEASDTFVLIAARTEGSNDTATYVLVGKDDVSLRDHVGRQVEVNGVVRAEQEVASRTRPQPTDRTAGTSGTPTVQTQTKVELKRLDVSAVRRLADECAS